jgi:hypothetical protein
MEKVKCTQILSGPVSMPGDLGLDNFGGNQNGQFYEISGASWPNG